MTRLLASRAVTAACASAASAASVPNGLIVFTSASGVGGKVQIWAMRANGTARHAVSPATSNEGAPALSHDGRRIAFVKRGDIYVMSVTGSKVRRLTFSASMENAPTWSPDGRSIPYSSYRSGHSSIWKMRSDGGQKTRLAGPLLLDFPA